MINKKVIACIAMMAMTASLVSGCGKKGPTKAELQNTVTALSNKNTSYEETIKQLKMVISNYNKNESVVQDLDSYFTLAADNNAYVNWSGSQNSQSKTYLDINGKRVNQNSVYRRSVM